MRLWKLLSEAKITKKLILGKNAEVVVDTTDGERVVALNSIGGGVETLTAARTLTKNDYGKTFFLALAGGFTVTLPTPAAGAYFKFVVKVAPTTAYIIASNGGANILIGGINELEVDTSDDGPYDDNADVINFVASTAVVGDWVEMISDGTSWYFTGQTNADGGITTATS